MKKTKNIIIISFHRGTWSQKQLTCTCITFRLLYRTYTPVKARNVLCDLSRFFYYRSLLIYCHIERRFCAIDLSRHSKRSCILFLVVVDFRSCDNCKYIWRNTCTACNRSLKSRSTLIHNRKHTVIS